MSTTPSEPEKADGGAPKLSAEQQVAASVAASAEEGWVGTGAPRYAPHPEDAPPSGSEQAWSADPHPGYQADPDSGISGKRLAAGVLVGAVVLAAGVFAGYAIVTAKSPNGNGSAAWTAAVTKDGAVVQGINAQNNVATKAALSDPAAQTVRDATAACNAATGNHNQLTATTGTIAGIGNWAIKATPDVNALKNDAAALGTAVAGDDVIGIATSAQQLCTALTTVSSLPAMPDAAGAAAWAAGITAYADAANSALQGAAGDKGALAKAAQDIAQGNTQMNTLSARIMAAT